MRFAVSIMLALALLVQSVAGLLAWPLAWVADGRTVATARMAGPGCCCEPGQDGMAECPLAQGGSNWCACEPTDSEQPVTPAPDQRAQSGEQTLAIVPSIVAILPLPVSAVLRVPAEPRPRHFSHSAQSILCVWLM